MTALAARACGRHRGQDAGLRPPGEERGGGGECVRVCGGGVEWGETNARGGARSRQLCLAPVAAVLTPSLHRPSPPQRPHLDVRGGIEWMAACRRRGRQAVAGRAGAGPRSDGCEHTPKPGRPPLVLRTFQLARELELMRESDNLRARASWNLRGASQPPPMCAGWGGLA